MVTDIEKLTKNMEAVEQGNMEIMVTSDSADEVGNLIRGFGNMINRINQLINEVYVGKISQKESEMRALQAQINPHFLYNSLSLINWKALETNQTDISRLTLLLSTFYRTALNRGKNVLSIWDEISNMNSYLEIQLMMHENSFSVVRDIDEDILEFQTLNLILQPLIENAIDHGIDMKEEGNGVITIGGHKDGNHILLSVEDNGVGMDEETAKSILSKESKGYGVRNVNERIMLYYGEAYHLTVESKLGEGTKITVRIPQIKM
jgi:two-component system sensor histidine kinase YesM